MSACSASVTGAHGGYSTFLDGHVSVQPSSFPLMCSATVHWIGEKFHIMKLTILRRSIRTAHDSTALQIKWYNYIDHASRQPKNSSDTHFTPVFHILLFIDPPKLNDSNTQLWHNSFELPSLMPKAVNMKRLDCAFLLFTAMAVLHFAQDSPDKNKNIELDTRSHQSIRST